MVLSVLHEAGWTEGAGECLIQKHTILSGHHLSFIYDKRKIRFYGAHLTAPNSIPYALMCDQSLHLPVKIARKAWEWALDELPTFKSCNFLGGISGQELAALQWREFLVETSLTYQKNLPVGLDILKSYGAKRRNIIRREASRLNVNHNAPVDEFLWHLNQTYIKKGVRPQDMVSLAKRMQWAIAENKGSVTSSYTDNGDFSAGVFCLWDRTLCHYLFGCTNNDLSVPEGNSLCLYEVMCQRQGLTSAFNFEGSVLKGVESFVRSFNPEPLLLASVRQTLWIQKSKHMPFLKRFIV